MSLVFVTSLASSSALAALISVDTVADVDLAGDGVCSLREAIMAANSDSIYNECTAGNGPDTIDFTVTGSILLNASLPPVTESLEINGPGFQQLTIDGSGAHQILSLPGSGAGGESFTLRQVKLRNGSTLNGPGTTGGAVTTGDGVGLTVDRVRFKDCSSVHGGAVYVSNNVVARFEKTTFRGNSATVGGALYLQRDTDVRILDSTFAGNHATGNGGALFSIYGGTKDLTVLRSTFSGNTTNASGGALALEDANVTIRHSTIVNNEADVNADGSGNGGGLFIEGSTSLTIKNTIAAVNEDLSPIGDTHPDISVDQTASFALTSGGFNFVGDNEGVSSEFPIPTAGPQNINGDYVGDASAPLDPLLDPLANNGGPTPTRVPQPGSPVIDRGDCTNSPNDQRIFTNSATGTRPVDDPNTPNVANSDMCDAGAIEVGATP